MVPPSARQTPAPVAARPPATVAGAPAPADPLVFQLLDEVGIVSQLSGNRAGRLLAPGLNLSQFSLLNNFARLGADGLAARQAAVQRLGQGLAPLAAVADAARLQQALAVLRDLRQWLDQNR